MIAYKLKAMWWDFSYSTSSLQSLLGFIHSLTPVLLILFSTLLGGNLLVLPGIKSRNFTFKKNHN